MSADRTSPLGIDDPAFGAVRLLRAREVAALLGVDRATVWRWVSRVENALPVVRFGSRCSRFRLCDVEAFVEANAGGGAGP